MKKTNSTNYKDWLEKGEHNLTDSRRLLEDGGYTDTICFLVHQAVEKYLKGYLVSKEINPPKIHRLEKLAKDCVKFDKGFSELLDECLFLSRYYIETRYPSLLPIEYSKEEARKAIKTAGKIIKFIDDRL